MINISKSIDLSKTIFEICKINPEVLDIMVELGFDNIIAPGMLNTAGRFMTIPKGAALKNVNLDKIKEVFKNRGYTIIE